MFKDKIVIVDIDSVVPYGKNAKVHTQKQVEALAQMISEFGWDQPIVVDGNMEIIKGHCRYRSAKHLGLKDVPVIVRSDLSAAKIKASRIADNKIAETDWDLELLETEIREIDNELLDYLGFQEAEIERLLSEEEKKQVSFDAKEYGEGDFSEFDHKCPKCGFEYDDK